MSSAPLSSAGVTAPPRSSPAPIEDLLWVVGRSVQLTAAASKALAAHLHIPRENHPVAGGDQARHPGPVHEGQSPGPADPGRTDRRGGLRRRRLVRQLIPPPAAVPSRPARTEP